LPCNRLSSNTVPGRNVVFVCNIPTVPRPDFRLHNVNQLYVSYILRGQKWSHR
jgi:hypothetical protein